MTDRIQLGSFELHPSERLLRLAGEPVELGARAFDLLLVLVEHHGRLVTKAQLLERVWPRVIVDENNLPAQVASLRRVLGAGAIRTVPGFGYRLELGVSNGVTAAKMAAPQAGSLEARPLSVPRRSWPDRLGKLAGRERELPELQQALASTSLLTIVGGAGVGKTRIAQELLARAGEATAATAWVSLQALQDAQHVPPAVALELGLSLPEGTDGFTALARAIEQESLLLILDGAEHLGPALATPLARLLARTRSLRLLVTSQAPLGIAGETVYRLAVLPVPEPGTPQALAVLSAAVQLFAARAAAADQRFHLSAANTAQVVEICRRLDGNPLALELAAARAPALGISTLLERLDDRLRLLTAAGRPHDPRHSTLNAAFEWSYGLLTPAEQRVFDRLGAFAGSFTLPAAARCVADEDIDTAGAIDLIGRLVDRSLVTALPVEPPRYVLLETARCYARNRLAAGATLHAAQERLAATMLALLDVAYQEYWSLDEAIWLHRYAPEIDNVRAAIDWASAHDRALGVALHGSAWPLFVELDLYAEARERYALALTLLTDTQPRARIARFWEAISTYDSTRQCDRARYAAELAAGIYAAAGDVRSNYYALMQLAFNWRGDDAAARAALDAARGLEDPAWPARLLAHGALTEGALLTSGGQFIDARVAYRRAVRFALTTSERLALAATVHIVELDIACGDTASALQLGRPLALSLRHSGRRETRFELLGVVFCALLLNGDHDEARATGAELYELALRLDTSRLYTVLDAMAYLACVDLRYAAAARIMLCADRTHAAHGQARRRPAEERMRASVIATLEGSGGAASHSADAGSRESLEEVGACALALGLRD